MSAKKEFQRLPKTIVPSNYNVTLTPNLQDFTFAGNETISIEVSYQILVILIMFTNEKYFEFLFWTNHEIVDPILPHILFSKSVATANMNHRFTKTEMLALLLENTLSTVAMVT